MDNFWYALAVITLGVALGSMIQRLLIFWFKLVLEDNECEVCEERAACERLRKIETEAFRRQDNSREYDPTVSRRQL